MKWSRGPITERERALIYKTYPLSCDANSGPNIGAVEKFIENVLKQPWRREKMLAQRVRIRGRPKLKCHSAVKIVSPEDKVVDFVESCYRVEDAVADALALTRLKVELDIELTRDGWTDDAEVNRVLARELGPAN